MRGVNLQQGNNSIRVSLTRPLGGYPRAISKIRKIRVKRNTNRIAYHLEVLPRAISKIRVKRNTNRIASHLEVLPRAISKIRKIRV